jgi:ABC-2 type transport system ATP-binding protein
LIKAFLIKPKVMLLDEPTASLDPEIAKEICDFVLEERKLSGVSVIYASHKMNEVAKVCDRVIFLKHGKIIANDMPHALAKSVSSFRLKLRIPIGISHAANLAKTKELSHSVEKDLIEITLEENKISDFLGALHRAEVNYEGIKIEEPSLDDYFIHMTRK